MSDIAIKFSNISKKYRLGLVSTRTLSHDLNRWWQTSILNAIYSDYRPGIILPLIEWKNIKK